MARRKRVRSNPRAVLDVLQANVEPMHRRIMLSVGTDYFVLASSRFEDDKDTTISFTVDVGNTTWGYTAWGQMNQSGKIHWRTTLFADLVEEYASIFDQMLVWLNDPSMPPAGVDEATYDVEI